MNNPSELEYSQGIFLQEITLYELNAAGETDPTTWIQSVVLPNTNIKKIVITHDLTTPVLTTDLFYEDVGLKIFTNFRATGRLFCKLIIAKSNNVNDYVPLEHNYLVSDIELIDKKSESCSYIIRLISSDILYFNNNILYSSRGVKKYTQILRDIFAVNKLTLDTSLAPDIDKQGFFLSSTEDVMIDDINNVLGFCQNSTYGIYFIRYDIMEKQYKLLSLKKIYESKDTTTLLENKLDLSTREQSKNFRLTANEIEEKNYLSYQDRIELAKPIRLYNFDYDTRTWKYDDIKRNAILDYMPKPQNTNFQYQPKSISKFISSDVLYDRRETLLRKFNVYNNMRSLFLYNDVIEFKVLGEITRQPGQLIFLDITDKSSYYKKYYGYWLIARVYHTFIKGSYMNIIQACRIDEQI